MAKHELATMPQKEVIASKLSEAILDFVSKIPASRESKSLTPAERSRTIANTAAASAALTAGSLSLPPGPIGWLTVIPEMFAVWKIQAQMVSNIAAIYGKSAALSKEQMLYCLFRHSASQAVRDLVVRVGERALIQQTSLRTLQSIARKIGIKLSQKAIGKGLSRWLPIVGAVGVGGYAYYDTAQIASTAIELFEQEIQVETGKLE